MGHEPVDISATDTCMRWECVQRAGELCRPVQWFCSRLDVRGELGILRQRSRVGARDASCSQRDADFWGKPYRIPEGAGVHVGVCTT